MSDSGHIGQELHEAVQAHRKRHPGMGYGAALRAVESQEPQMVANYLAEGIGAPGASQAPSRPVRR